ncbi:hypothetical protein [Gemmatimonas aurantiaca]|uniref:hypothetical protein n=1 Tax=Gemmatimonas aurantiaca TaxID=173480 RepID=UPI00301E001C
MHRLLLPHRFLIACLSLPLAGCLAVTDVGNNGGYYARMRGSVTRADGTVVPRAPIGISCLGRDAVPFGYTTDTDANGRFDIDLAVSVDFVPLEGGFYLCRVLTPYTGPVQAEKTVPTAFSGSSSSPPTTEVALVIP